MSNQISIETFERENKNLEVIEVLSQELSIILNKDDNYYYLKGGGCGYGIDTCYERMCHKDDIASLEFQVGNIKKSFEKYPYLKGKV